MKLMSKSVVINKTKPSEKYGNWGGIQGRSRKGFHYDFNYDSLFGYNYNQDRILSVSEMWAIYRRCADVRAAIDSIVRRVATFDWLIVPTVSPQNPDHKKLSEISDDIRMFLEKPNKNGDTWQEIMTAMLTDTLCFDAGALEKVFDSNGNLQELVPLRGPTIVPDKDEYGRLQGYNQILFQEGDRFSISGAPSESVIKFGTDDIMYLSLFKNNAMAEGNPLLESLVNEVLTLLRSTQHSLLALDADEIPPGILVLAGISGAAAERAKADMQSLKGQDNKIRIMTTPDPTGVGAKWLELRHTPKDLEMRDIVDDIRRTVFRVFGVMPVEMGLTADMPRATATVQIDVSSSHLVTPILELLQAKINTQILPALIKDKTVAKYIKFQFDRKSKMNPDEQQKLAQTHSTYIKQGVMTRNEVREIIGMLPIVGGDVPTIEVAGMPQPLMSIVAQFDNEDIEKYQKDEPDINDEVLDNVDINNVEDFTEDQIEDFKDSNGNAELDL
jgi:hypothetical protein